VSVPAQPLGLVLDNTVLLAGLVSKSSASEKVVDSLQVRKAIPLRYKTLRVASRLTA